LRNYHIPKFTFLKNTNYYFLSFLAILLIIEISLSNISDIINRQLSSQIGIALFIVIFLISLVGEYVIFKNLKLNQDQFKNEISYIKKINKISIFIQILLNFVVIIIISKILSTSDYPTFSLTIVTTISYSLAIFNMGLLSFMFFKWFKIKRNALHIIFGLGSLFVVFNALISIILFDNVLLQKASTIPYNTIILFPGFDQGTFMSWIFNFQTYTNISYFVLMWLGTIILLKFKINKIGLIKFCILSFLPLIYFMSYYFTIYDSMNPSTPIAASYNMMGLILFFGFSIVGGGVIVSIGFREIAKSINNKNIKNFILMTALGFLLYFISGSASIGQTPYPPYGIIGISLVGLSSLLILNGLYMSAIYLTTDRRLRNLVKSKIDASRLLDSIGTAQMHIEMEKVTLRVIEEQNKNTDLKNIDTKINESDIKSYIDDILIELKKKPK
jgi:hypothetical protein